MNSLDSFQTFHCYLNNLRESNIRVNAVLNPVSLFYSRYKKLFQLLFLILLPAHRKGINISISSQFSNSIMLNFGTSWQYWIFITFNQSHYVLSSYVKTILLRFLFHAYLVLSSYLSISGNKEIVSYSFLCRPIDLNIHNRSSLMPINALLKLSYRLFYY